MPKTAIEQLSGNLRKDIIHGIIKSGEHIKEKEIAVKYKVSRIPVREALMQLENEGYLVKIPRKGNFVRSLTRNSVEESLLIYENLVPLILNDAITKYSKKTYSDVEKILHKIECSDDSLEITDLVWDFKKKVFEKTKYIHIFSIVENVFKQSMRLVSILIESMEQKSFNVSSYKKFMKLCKKNKKTEAIKVFMDFLKIERKLLMGMFN
ncbi:MAG: GntR family transcriptional regulator [Ignavibacteria bacterium]|nr:GntR family transcriptional regulator [Ignavibacteria bacterium]